MRTAIIFASTHEPRVKPHYSGGVAGSVSTVQQGGNRTCVLEHDTDGVPVNLIPSTFRRHLDLLYFSGGHGNFENGAPTQMNGLNYDRTEELVAQLMSMNVTATSIVMDCCFSAGFVPLFRSLLPEKWKNFPPSTIISHICSAMGTCSNSLYAQDASRGTRTTEGHWVVTLKKTLKRTLVDQISGNDGILGQGFFTSYCLYAHAEKTVYWRKSGTPQTRQASNQYVQLITGNPQESEYDDVEDLIEYLDDQNISLKILNRGAFENAFMTKIRV